MTFVVYSAKCNAVENCVYLSHPEKVRGPQAKYWILFPALQLFQSVDSDKNSIFLSGKGGDLRPKGEGGFWALGMDLKCWEQWWPNRRHRS